MALLRGGARIGPLFAGCADAGRVSTVAAASRVARTDKFTHRLLAGKVSIYAALLHRNARDLVNSINP
jgi:hypothetical protein